MLQQTAPLMALSILALCVFIFGAYAYGSVVVLSFRHRNPVWPCEGSPGVHRLKAEAVGLAMLVACTLWFVLHSLIEFRFLLGDPRNDDFFDLSVLELVFAFPGLIFHTVLVETAADDDGRPRPESRIWSLVLATLYTTGVVFAVYFPAAIFDVVPGPQPIGPYIGFSVGAHFTISSMCCMLLIASRPRQAPTRDQRRLRTAIMGLFASMIVLFLVLSFARERQLLIEILDVAVRTTPLAFLVVSVYFENRIEFYDLVIKRGVILVLSLLVLGSGLAMSLDWLDRVPANLARPWLFAVILLPLAMLMPWLHGRVGRLLDRLWFGRDFTPVEAVKHVLGAMQQATDQVSLIAATETTLSEMFRRHVVILLEEQPLPDKGGVAIEIRMPGSLQPIRLVIVNEPGARPVLSEDHALLKSLGGVFAFMLENVRLQRKRQEQEQFAQELRLQTSRSELKALRAQINPHFLFNALNAIASLIHTDPVRADAAVEQLAEVFRYTLRRSDQEWAPLDQELAFARAYLDVEQARFGRRLEFSIDADPTLGRAQVPSMLLQTLVENAVKHGISRLRTPGRIDVRAVRSDGCLTLEVRDTGPGPDTAGRHPTPGGESFGLRSVRDRLQGHFGAQASLDLLRERDTTVARIRLPLIEQQPSPMVGATR